MQFFFDALLLNNYMKSSLHILFEFILYWIFNWTRCVCSQKCISPSGHCKTSWRFIDSSSEEASARADMWFVITEDNGQYWSGPRGAVMNTDPWADIKNATDDPAALLDRVNISGPPLNTKQLGGHCYIHFHGKTIFLKPDCQKTL